MIKLRQIRHDQTAQDMPLSNYARYAMFNFARYVQTAPGMPCLTLQGMFKLRQIHQVQTVPDIP
jgi:hypothetical protein